MAPTVSPPRGMRDALPADTLRRRRVLDALRAAYGAYGYQEIETPAMEELARLQSGQGGDNEKLVFRVLRRGLDPEVPVRPAEAADLGLRFDLTVPLARFYASHRAELPAVFRAMQLAPVWRAERPQKGRYRQFTQCDIDVLGEPGTLAEVELIAATVDALGRLGLTATVRLNDRAVLAALLGHCGVDEADRAGVLVSVDKLDKLGVAGVADELAAADLDPSARRNLVGVLEELSGAAAERSGFDATLARLPAPAAEAAGRLREIRSALALAAPEADLVADPTLVRGMGYYTGPIFELTHPSFAGSVGGGGRYDGMIGRFAGVDVPACGFSVGFERIVDLVELDRLGVGPRLLALVADPATPAGVVVAWQRALIAEGAEVRVLRRPRNLARALDALGADGVGEWAELGADAAPPGLGPPPSRRQLT